MNYSLSGMHPTANSATIVEKGGWTFMRGCHHRRELVHEVFGKPEFLARRKWDK